MNGGEEGRVVRGVDEEMSIRLIGRSQRRCDEGERVGRDSQLQMAGRKKMKESTPYLNTQTRDFGGIGKEAKIR
ncbi:hypothetical protein PS1_007942 [Malus domestica]